MNSGYLLRVYDNFHSLSESDAYDHGTFTIYEEAVEAAKRIVEISLRENFEFGMSASDLILQYSVYGDHPVIIPINPSGKSNPSEGKETMNLFSSAEFAAQIYQEVWKSKTTPRRKPTKWDLNRFGKSNQSS